MCATKRKVDAKCRIFNEVRGVKYFCVETADQKASCVICSGSVAVLKEYNLWRHYEALKKTLQVCPGVSMSTEDIRVRTTVWILQLISRNKF